MSCRSWRRVCSLVAWLIRAHLCGREESSGGGDTGRAALSRAACGGLNQMSSLRRGSHSCLGGSRWGCTSRRRWSSGAGGGRSSCSADNRWDCTSQRCCSGAG
ncbi:hypothetical protein JKP88DRAFT_347266, partial [Tribonema minus]